MVKRKPTKFQGIKIREDRQDFFFIFFFFLVLKIIRSGTPSLVTVFVTNNLTNKNFAIQFQPVNTISNTYLNFTNCITPFFHIYLFFQNFEKQEKKILCGKCGIKTSHNSRKVLQCNNDFIKKQTHDAITGFDI